MTRYSFDEVIKMDQALHQLAAYEVTHGMMVNPKTQEEFLELNDKIARKFNYFKGLIQNKECNFQFIKENVLQKNGPFPKEPFNIEKLDPKQLDDVNDIVSQDNGLHNFAADILKAFIPSTQNNDAENILDKLGIKIIVSPMDIKNPILPVSSENSEKPIPNVPPPKKRNSKKPRSKKK